MKTDIMTQDAMRDEIIAIAKKYQIYGQSPFYCLHNIANEEFTPNGVNKDKLLAENFKIYFEFNMVTYGNQKNSDKAIIEKAIKLGLELKTQNYKFNDNLTNAFVLKYKDTLSAETLSEIQSLNLFHNINCLSTLIDITKLIVDDLSAKDSR